MSEIKKSQRLAPIVFLVVIFIVVFLIANAKHDFFGQREKTEEQPATLAASMVDSAFIAKSEKSDSFETNSHGTVTITDIGGWQFLKESGLKEIVETEFFKRSRNPRAEEITSVVYDNLHASKLKVEDCPLGVVLGVALLYADKLKYDNTRNL